MRRLFQTDFLLWALLGVSFSVTRIFTQYRRGRGDSWLDQLLAWAERDFDDFDFIALRLLTELYFLSFPLLLLAWLPHSFLLRCGVRLSGRRPLDQTADYDDALPTGPIYH
ncbi:MAG TPA: hypothetical protein VKD90_20740 [Gemmataceae bacterium]|nr:hypothetical protein [Gemmataceae bacterium]